MKILKKTLGIIGMAIVSPFWLIWLVVQLLWYIAKRLLGFIRCGFGWIIGALLLMLLCGLCGYALDVKILRTTATGGSQSYTNVTTPTPTIDPSTATVVPYNSIVVGHWSGQGQYDQEGRDPFPMDLIVTRADSLGDIPK